MYNASYEKGTSHNRWSPQGNDIFSSAFSSLISSPPIRIAFNTASPLPFYFPLWSATGERWGGRENRVSTFSFLFSSRYLVPPSPLLLFTCFSGRRRMGKGEEAKHPPPSEAVLYVHRCTARRNVYAFLPKPKAKRRGSHISVHPPSSPRLLRSSLIFFGPEAIAMILPTAAAASLRCFLARKKFANQCSVRSQCCIQYQGTKNVTFRSVRKNAAFSRGGQINLQPRLCT